MTRANGRDDARDERPGGHPRIRAFEHCPRRGHPIIAMTANVFADDVKACLEAGMNSHVGKPLDMQVLAAEIWKIRRHTAQRRAQTLQN
ncbi:MAG: hypothetical protein ACLVHY_07420 [Gemmiger sp.]